MKKILLLFISIFSFSIIASASDSFYIGFKVDNIRYVKDKNGKIVYSPEFRAIQKNGTDELAYCIQPGVLISDGSYEPFEEYNEKFNITKEQMENVKKIARYGYLYENHTDIKWYVVTQYMIWHAVMPENWDIYFVDENKNRISDMFKNEINEINNLVSNAHEEPDISKNYEFNYQEDIYIYDDNNLLKFYVPSSGKIVSNHLYINNNLAPGDYSYNLSLINNKKPIFYNHQTGQDLFTQGEILKNNINFNIHITAGKLSINECDEETFEKDFVGGTYEILDIDDSVVEEITCKENEECLSNILPIGSYKIRVKSLTDDYELNENIYDVLVTDQNTSNVSVCSLKKERNINISNISQTNLNITNSDNRVYNSFTNVINNTTNVINNITNTNVVNKYIYKKYNSDNTLQVNSTITNESSASSEVNINNSKTNTNAIDTKTIKTCIKDCVCKKDNDIKNTLFKENKIDEFKTIDVPNTKKDSYVVIYIVLFALITYYFGFIHNEKHI
ncbi:MAG: thioester domain-containing protein [Bacilli bacterium]|nr:thioester domain-containing protein [Bacilli bacterium]